MAQVAQIEAVVQAPQGHEPGLDVVILEGSKPVVEVGDRGAAEQVGRVEHPVQRGTGGKLLDTHGQGRLGGQ